MTDEPVADATIDLEDPFATPPLLASYDIGTAMEATELVPLIKKHALALGVAVSGTYSTAPTVPGGGWENFPAADPAPAPLPPEPPPGEEPRPIECINEIPDGEDVCHD